MTDDLDKFLNELTREVGAGVASRPDADPADLLVPVMGTGDPKSAKTVAEVNASGEETVFVCLKCRDAPTAPIPGATEKRCTSCRSAVWMSPATEGVMNRLANTRILCIQCAGEEAKKANDKGKA